MAELKTRENNASVAAFIAAIEDPEQRSDARKIATMMRAASGSRPRIWGTSIVGFGSYHYRYASGREGDWPIVGFSPRKQNIAVYIMAGFSGSEKLLGKLGKHKTGKSCLYIKRLDDIDQAVLRKLIDESIQTMQKKYTTRK